MFDLKIIQTLHHDDVTAITCNMSEASIEEFSRHPDTITLLGVTFIKRDWRAATCEILYVSKKQC